MRQIILVCFLVLAWAVPGQASQGGPDPRTTRDRFASYLERKPFHEQAFGRLIEAAAASDGVAALRAKYEERAALEDAKPATHIVLARLWARDGELVRALESLGQLESQSRALDVLRGRLLLAAGRPQEAADLLTPAAQDPGALDRRLAEEVFGLLAQAHLAAGNRVEASSALRAQGDLDPTSFELALEIADALVQAGLQEAALEEFERASALVGQDSERICRVLSRSGRLHERREEFGKAIADYGQALERLRRGHWLERELASRLGRAHRDAGSLPAYAAELEARVVEHPGQLGLRERLYQARLDLHDPQAAREVLAEATRVHPLDLPLGRAYADQLDRAGLDEERAVELQRILAVHPGEMDLYLDLGRLLARGGKLEQARRQWERSLEQREGDVGFVLRLAQLFDRYGLSAEAAELVERVIAQEPDVLAHYAELGGLALRAADHAEVQRTLDRAAIVAGEDTAGLEELASIARGLRRKDAAREYLEKAVLLDAQDARLWRLLATVAGEQRDDERAQQALRQVLATAQELTLQREVLTLLVRRAKQRGNLRILIESELVGAQAGEVVPALIVARAYRKQNRESRALETLLVAAEAGGDLLQEEHVAVLESLGRAQEAVAMYERLAEERPARKVSYLREVVRLHRAEGQFEEAAAVVERILVASPNLPAVWRDAARSFQQLEQEDRALEVMQRAVDLDPKDGDLRLAHAEMLLGAGRLERAVTAAREAAQSGDEDLADRARAWLHRRLVMDRGVEAEMQRLRAVLTANPYDDRAALALIDLFERELEYSLALDLIGELLDARPQAVQLLDLRARLLGDMGRWEASLEDLDRLRRLDALDRVALAGREAWAALSLGQSERAERALARMPARRAAAVYRKAGLNEKALACLEAERARQPEDSGLLHALLALYQRNGDREAAETVLEELLGGDAESAEAHLRRGDLAFAFQDGEAGTQWYARSLALDTPTAVPAGLSRRESRRLQRRLKSKFWSKMTAIQNRLRGHDSWYANTDMFIQATRLRPDNPLLLTRALSPGSAESRGRELLELLRFVRAETLDKGQPPSGLSPRRWESQLQNLERRLVQNHAELASERSAQLQDVQGLNKAELKEALSLARKQSDDSQLRRVTTEMLERDSDDRRALALLILLDQDANDLDAVEAGMRRLLEMKALVRARAKLSELPRVPRTFHRREQGKLRQNLREAFTEEIAAQYYYLGRSARWGVGWERSATPGVEGLLASLGVLLAEQGRESEARELLVELLPPSPYMLAQIGKVVQLYRDLEWNAEGEELALAARKRIASVLDDPLLSHGLRITPEISEMMLSQGDEESDATVLERYKYDRLWVGPMGRARSLLAGEDGDQIRAELKLEWESALGQSLAFRSLRLPGVLYGETLALQEDWAALEELITGLVSSLAEADPTDRTQLLKNRDDQLELCELRSLVLVKQERLPRAVELLRSDVERSEAALLAGSWKMPARQVGFDDEVSKPADPRRPAWFEIPAENVEALSKLKRSLVQGIEYSAMGGQPTAGAPRDFGLRAQLFNLLAYSSRHEEALECFTEMIHARPRLLGWVQYEVMNAVETTELKGSALGFTELLYRNSTSNPRRLLDYGQLLIENGQEEEATRLYQAFLTSGAKDTEEVEKALQELRPTAKLDLVSAEAEVAADPRNVGLRRDLARSFFGAGRYQAGAVHGLEASALAPHLDEVRLMGIGSLLVMGRDAEWEVAADRELQSGDLRNSRLPLAVRLGARMWNRGEEKATVEFFAGLGKRLNWRHKLSFCRFFLERGRLDIAIDQLELEAKIVVANQPWSRNWMDKSLGNLRLRSGRGLLAMQGLVPMVVREADGESLKELLGRLERLIRRGSQTQLRLAAIREYAGQEEGRTEQLCRLAANLVEGRADLAEPVLMELGLASAQSRDLCSRAVASAAAREDWSMAAEYLEAIEARYPPSRRRKTAPGAELTERQAMDLELGGYQIRAGQVQFGLERLARAYSGGPKLKAGASMLMELIELDAGELALEHWREREDAGKSVPGLDVKARMLALVDDHAGAFGNLVEFMATRLPEESVGHILPLALRLARLLRDEGVDVNALLDVESGGKAGQALAWLVLELDLERSGWKVLEGLTSDEVKASPSPGELLELESLAGWWRGDQSRVVDSLERLHSLEQELELGLAPSWSWRAWMLVQAGENKAAEAILGQALNPGDDEDGGKRLANKLVSYGLRQKQAAARPANLDSLLDHDLRYMPMEEVTDPSSKFRAALKADPAGMQRERERFDASGGGSKARLRFGAVCYGAGQNREAAELLGSVARDDPDRIVARLLLHSALIGAGDTADALAVIEELHDYVGRAARVAEAGSTLQTILDKLRLLALLRDGGEAAASAWLTQTGGRSEGSVRSNEYNIYRINVDSRVPYYLRQMATKHGLWHWSIDVAKVAKSYGSRGHWLTWRLGQREQAWEDFVRDIRTSKLGEEGDYELLLRLGNEGELLESLREDVLARGGPFDIYSADGRLLVRLAEGRQDWERVLELLGIPERAEDHALGRLRVKALRQLGRYQEALDYVAVRSPLSWLRMPTPPASESDGEGLTGLASNSATKAPAGGIIGNSASVVAAPHSGAASEVRPGARPMGPGPFGTIPMVLAREAGQVELAEILEQRYFARKTVSQPQLAMREIIRGYMTEQQWTRAGELIARLEGHDSEMAAALREELAQARRDPAARLGHILAEGAKEDSGAVRLRNLARELMLAGGLEEVSVAREWLQVAETLELATENLHVRETEAWIALAEGDEPAARRAFREAYNWSRVAGWRELEPPASLVAGLALARAEVDGTAADEAAPAEQLRAVLRALSRLSESPLRARLEVRRDALRP